MTPAIPDAGSTKPLSATSRCLMEIAPWNGVSATSLRLNGPASPSTVIVPPAGAFGHAVAALFGADPKSEMDVDLLRMKAMIETGRAPHDAAQPG